MQQKAKESILFEGSSPKDNLIHFDYVIFHNNPMYMDYEVYLQLKINGKEFQIREIVKYGNYQNEIKKVKDEHGWVKNLPQIAITNILSEILKEYIYEELIKNYKP